MGYPICPGTESDRCWIGRLMKYTPDGDHYPSHDIGHFPVSKVMLQADYSAYITTGKDNRPKGSSVDATEGSSSEKDQAAAKIQAVHRGNAVRKDIANGDEKDTK